MECIKFGYNFNISVKLYPAWTEVILSLFYYFLTKIYNQGIKNENVGILKDGVKLNKN